MEKKSVMFVILNIGLVAIATGSSFHSSGVPYPQLLPYELTYSNAHSSVLLPQYLGGRVEAALAAAPVFEASLEEISANCSPTGAESKPSYPSASILPSTAQTSTSLNEIATPSAAPSPALGAESPLPINADDSALDFKLLDSTSRGAFYFDVNGKLQMQATVTSSGEKLPVITPQTPDVPIMIPELPVVVTAKPIKPQSVANVNVNVNVNVNGDAAEKPENTLSLPNFNASQKYN